jgi:hypothetical protein
MSEKSRLYRTGKEINHSIKTQQHDFEVFHAREFELVVDGLSAFLPGRPPIIFGRKSLTNHKKCYVTKYIRRTEGTK